MNQQKNPKKYYSTAEVADLLHLDRTTIFNKIKSGEIKAEKVGRNYVIPIESLGFIFDKTLDETTKKKINKSVDRVIHDYGETIKKLADD